MRRDELEELHYITAIENVAPATRTDEERRKEAVRREAERERKTSVVEVVSNAVLNAMGTLDSLGCPFSCQDS